MSDTRPSSMLSASDPATLEAAGVDAAYRQARRRVRMLRGWYIHALVYGCVIGGLWAIYAFSGQGARSDWPLPATLGWGLGLAIHALLVWLGTSARGRQWESRKIEEYMKEEVGARRAVRQ